jgi:hypothetical protein
MLLLKGTQRPANEIPYQRVDDTHHKPVEQNLGCVRAAVVETTPA